MKSALESGVSPDARCDDRCDDDDETPLLSIAAEVYVYLFISISIMLINLFCILCTFRMIIWIWLSFWLRKAPAFTRRTATAKLLFGSLHKYVLSPFNSWGPESHLRELLNQNGHLDIVKILIEKGANINQMNSWRQTPLWGAISVRFFFVLVA